MGVFEAGFVDWAATKGLSLDDDDDDDGDDDDDDGGDDNDDQLVTMDDNSDSANDASAVVVHVVEGPPDARRLSSEDDAPSAMSMKKRLFDALNNVGIVGRVLTVVIFGLIAMTITTACLGTVESLNVPAANRTFAVIEGICTVLFTIEYLLRL